MSKGTKTEGGRVRMIWLPAKGQQETGCRQINKTLGLYISSVPESQMLLRKRTKATACSQSFFSLNILIYLLSGGGVDVSASLLRLRPRVNLFTETYCFLLLRFAVRRIEPLRCRNADARACEDKPRTARCARKLSVRRTLRVAPAAPFFVIFSRVWFQKKSFHNLSAYITPVQGR